ncbi:Crp/Fnr family transcriptional regulator [Flavobacterium geliluteum]|uniref:Crp/Fnr family transcriptional regulator n=1 Tax=Flavobacterium geliluteum TaxID=2816120 RepID=UPI001F1BBF86|nr:Crp/Fnr family transcriptional regulator [Flavobacterium geliluteum]
MTESEFELIATYFTERKFKRGDYVVRQGIKVDHTFFVVEGMMKLIFDDESGKEHILSFAMENWWETDYLAFHKRTQATMSLKCLEDTTVICLSFEDYHNLCAAVSKMEHFFLNKATSGHLASQQRILSLLASTAQERYFKLIHNYPSLTKRVSKSQLASYLGLSRETLSRLYKGK